MIGFIVGLVDRAQGKKWNVIAEGGLAVGLIYVVLGMIGAVLGYDTLLASLGTVTSPILIMLAGLSMVTLIILAVPLGFVAGILEVFVGALVYEFKAMVQKEIKL